MTRVRRRPPHGTRRPRRRPARALWLSVLCLGLHNAGAQHEPSHTVGEVVTRYEELAAAHPREASYHRDLGLAYLAVDALKRAEAAFSRAVELDGEDHAAGFWVGRTRYLRGQYESAARMFERLTGLVPGRYETHADLGLTYLRLHRYADAKRELEVGRVLLAASSLTDASLSPPDILDGSNPQWRDKVAPLGAPEIDYYLALAAFEQGDMAACVRHCDRSLDDSRSARALYRRGLALSRLDERQAAKRDFAAATELQPTLHRAHYQLALAHLRDGEQVEGEEAMARFQQLRKAAAAHEEQRKALLRNSDKTSILVELGRIKLAEGSYADAAREFQKAVWHDPAAASAHLGLSHTYALLGRFAEARRAQVDAAALAPDTYEVDSGLAWILMREAKHTGEDDDYTTALDAYRLLTERSPADAESWLHRGQLARRLSLLTEARDALEAWILLPRGADEPDSTQVQVHLAAADVCLRQDDLAAAEGHYKAVLRRDPNVAEAYFNMGFIATRFGRPDQAVRFYEATVQLDPDMPQAHYLLGRLYADQKDLERGTASLLRAVKLDPTLAEAYERLAYLHAVDGKHLERAREFALKSVELQPASTAALNTLSWIFYLLGDYSPAEEAVLEALRLAPDSAAYRQGLEAIRAASKESP